MPRKTKKAPPPCVHLILPKKPLKPTVPTPPVSSFLVSREVSPPWDCEDGALSQLDADTPTDPPTPRQSQNMKSPHWKAWQD
ncbi:hypothetical protein Hypma_004870 [Hypsizygus marmoreus]|uniref:Uncharacterized protein n=1 Tax=Hypsizygus marmoreus TaxID=39966 RepID=A0A369J182_HYPMA|nr:hypothetical protein Hypma_004870 [Hypsizygus marmoreus]